MFDNSYCDYLNHGDIPWIIGRGIMKSPPENWTRPPTKTFWAYVDWTSAKQGQKAILTSPLSETSGYHCLQFSYFVNGPMFFDVTRVDVNRRTVIFSWVKQKIVENQWTTPKITIPGDVQFKLEFMASIGTGQNFIALSEVIVTPGVCEQHQSELISPGQLSCNFSSGDSCSWTTKTVRRDDGGLWTINSIEERKTSPWLPKSDHTSGKLDGRYYHMFAFRETGRATSSLTLKETGILDEGSYCLSFWYILNGNDKNRLTVIIIDIVSYIF